MGLWGRQWLDPAKSSESGFTKASCQCSHCLYSQEVQPENVRNRPHCRNTDGLWDGRPLGHDACAATGIEFRGCFRLLPEGLWEVDKDLLSVGELTGMGAERASSSWELNMSHFPLSVINHTGTKHVSSCTKRSWEQNKSDLVHRVRKYLYWEDATMNQPNSLFMKTNGLLELF